MTKRRDFLVGAAASTAVGMAGLARAQGQPAEKAPVIVFEKPFQKMPYAAMGEWLQEQGFNGIEATVRRGGHIKIEEAADKVPGMVADLAKSNQQAHIVATHVGDASPENEKFLRILKDNGIKRYRMDYFSYDLNGDMLKQAREYNAKAKDLAALNKELGIQGIYQLHSGAKLVGGMSWDLALVLEGIDPADLGIGFDLRHFRTDSGLSWRAAKQVCRPHVQALYVKDAKWVGEGSKKLRACRLGTGFVDYPLFAASTKGLPPMPVSLHMEWGRHNVYPEAELQDALARVAIDKTTLDSWMSGEKEKKRP